MTELEPCARDIFERGEVVGMKAIPKEVAEAEVERLRRTDPTHRYDWHYVAGRAVFKRLAIEPEKETSDVG